MTEYGYRLLLQRGAVRLCLPSVRWSTRMAFRAVFEVPWVPDLGRWGPTVPDHYGRGWGALGAPLAGGERSRILARRRTLPLNAGSVPAHRDVRKPRLAMIGVERGLYGGTGV